MTKYLDSNGLNYLISKLKSNSGGCLMSHLYGTLLTLPKPLDIPGGEGALIIEFHETTYGIDVAFMGLVDANDGQYIRYGQIRLCRISPSGVDDYAILSCNKDSSNRITAIKPKEYHSLYVIQPA